VSADLISRAGNAELGSGHRVKQRIHHLYRPVALPRFKIFRVEDRCTRILGSLKYQRIPKGSFVAHLQVQRQYVKSVVGASTLNQLREARNLTQANLAGILGVNQGSVSKMEKRTDMYVSTLRSFIQAMGGQLQIKAVFPEGEVQIEQFGKLAVSRDADSVKENGA